MIKIEFKEAHQGWHYSLEMPNEFKSMFFNYPYKCLVRVKNNIYVDSITFGYPSELVPSRDEILQQLGISKQQDEQTQQKYK